MSKAFTRELDDQPDRPDPPRQSLLLPPGAKNYLTPDGAARFREELDQLVHQERPATAALADGPERRQRLDHLDRRINRIQQILQSAHVVPRPAASEQRIRFGATVAVRDSQGRDATFRIVGVDETDLDRGWVSWVSPIAKSLLNKSVGDRVRHRLPSGEEELEIIGVSHS